MSNANANAIFPQNPELRPFEIVYKTSPSARKTRRAVQFHKNAESAKSLKLIRDYDCEAVCLSVREMGAEEAKEHVACRA